MIQAIPLDRRLGAGPVPMGFADERERKRLNAIALEALRRLFRAWGVGNAEAAALLGVSGSTWDRIKAGRWTGTLGQDQMTRASALIGLYKGLHLLFADGMADRWPGLPNRAAPFAGRSPIATMIEGGIPLMLETRNYIDALRGGL
ncbi:MAG: hypothetical protein Kow00104_08670 [Rhodothalassiaceae bacterium]